MAAESVSTRQVNAVIIGGVVVASVAMAAVATVVAVAVVVAVATVAATTVVAADMAIKMVSIPNYQFLHLHILRRLNRRRIWWRWRWRLLSLL
jgi:predicted nucleotidyltransferase